MGAYRPNGSWDRGLTRREAAKLAAAAGAAAYLTPGWRALAQGGRPTQSYDDGSEAVPGGLRGDPERVIVIGAGFAGLTAANALRNAGVEVVVLEARHRLGGRANTRDLGGVPVDSGASWIHEPIGNPMTRFAGQAGVDQRSADIELDLPTMRAFDEVRGRAVGAPELVDAFVRGVRFGESLDEYAERLGEGSSIRDAATLFLDEEGVGGDKRRLTEFAIRLIAEHTDNAFWHAIDLPASARYDPLYDGIGQGDFPVGGYRPIIEAMAGSSEVRLGHRVTAIERDRNGARVKVFRRRRRGKGRKGRSRYVIRGSHVLVTVPLGVLKRDGIRFSPRLPQAKRAAISGVGFGRFEKVSMLFDEPFWTEGGKTHILRVNDRPPVAFSLMLDHQKLSGYPALTALAAGRFVNTIRRQRGGERMRGVLAILDGIFGRTVPRPIAVETTDWLGDRFSRGAYSFIRRGGHEDQLDTLSEPVGGRLLFAGEATNSARFGYTDGAMSSGVREAKRLLGRSSVDLSAG